MNTTDESRDFDQLRAEVGGRTTKIVLDMLQNQDNIGSIKDRTGKAHQTILYHVNKLKERDLIEKTEEVEGRKYYKITEKGSVVLKGMNVPRY